MLRWTAQFVYDLKNFSYQEKLTKLIARYKHNHVHITMTPYVPQVNTTRMIELEHNYHSLPNFPRDGLTHVQRNRLGEQNINYLLIKTKLKAIFALLFDVP